MSKRAEQAWTDYEYREHPKGLYYTCFVDGHEQAEKDTIERACEWLKKHCWFVNEGTRVEVDVDKFRKALEEE